MCHTSGDAGARYHTRTAAEKGCSSAYAIMMYHGMFTCECRLAWRPTPLEYAWLHYRKVEKATVVDLPPKTKKDLEEDQRRYLEQLLDWSATFFVNLLSQVEVYEVGCLSLYMWNFGWWDLGPWPDGNLTLPIKCSSREFWDFPTGMLRESENILECSK